MGDRRYKGGRKGKRTPDDFAERNEHIGSQLLKSKISSYRRLTVQGKKDLRHTREQDIGWYHHGAIASLENAGGVLEIISLQANILFHPCNIGVLEGLKIEKLREEIVSHTIYCVEKGMLTLVKKVRHPNTRIIRSCLTRSIFSALVCSGSNQDHL